MIPTVRDFLLSKWCVFNSDNDTWEVVDTNDLIEFAKMHVEQALNQASEEAECMYNDNYLDKERILNAYDLSDIK